jgi:hypothetical protein
MALFNVGRGLLSAAIAPGPPERFRDKRPQLKNGRVAARPDWEELVPTFQDGLEFVGKMVARSAATAVMGPIMEGIEALHSIQAVKDAMSVYHEIVELSERLEDIKHAFSQEIFGVYLEKIQDLCELKEKGEEIKGKYDEVMEYFDRISSKKYPQSERFYHIKNKASGYYLQVGSFSANGQRMMYTSTKKGPNTAFALVHTSRKGVVILESLQFPG